MQSYVTTTCSHPLWTDPIVSLRFESVVDMSVSSPAAGPVCGRVSWVVVRWHPASLGPQGGLRARPPLGAAPQQPQRTDSQRHRQVQCWVVTAVISGYVSPSLKLNVIAPPNSPPKFNHHTIFQTIINISSLNIPDFCHQTAGVIPIRTCHTMLR